MGFPKANQGSLHTLYRHFQEVAKVTSNKMDIANLATVFGPTLLSGASTTTTINSVSLHGEILHAILGMFYFIDIDGPTDVLPYSNLAWLD